LMFLCGMPVQCWSVSIYCGAVIKAEFKRHQQLLRDRWSSPCRKEIGGYICRNFVLVSCFCPNYILSFMCGSSQLSE
jgi:hypothetical protein